MTIVIIATLAARPGKNEQKGSTWAYALGYHNCGKRIEAEAHMYKVIPTKSMISIDLKPPPR